MTTTISTVEDLMRVLDTHPEWLEAMRSRLLDREILEMPENLAELAGSANRRFESIEHRLDQIERRMELVERRLDQIERRMELVERRLDQIERRMELVERRLDQIERRLDQIERGLQRLEDKTGTLLGAHARNQALREIGVLSKDMGMVRVRRLWGFEDLDELVRSSNTTGIPAHELKSFRRADAVVEAVDEEDRTTYIAVEISYTVNGRDTRRAIRNAEYMTRFTGEPCRSAIMGVRLDDNVRQVIGSGDLYWYRLDPEIMEVE